MAQPFAAGMLDRTRLATLARTSAIVGDLALCRAAYEHDEPHPRWDLQDLQRRAVCYQRTGSPLTATALRDVQEFLARAPSRFAAFPRRKVDAHRCSVRAEYPSSCANSRALQGSCSSSHELWD